MVKKLKLAVLAEDSGSEHQRDVIAKHGLSFLIEAEGDGDKVSVLVDTGPSPDIVLHNAEVMGVDLAKIDMVFLSHGHYDHTGGLVGILKQINKEVPVVAHPKVFGLKLKLDPNLKYIGSPFKPSEVEASGGVLLLARNPVTLAKGGHNQRRDRARCGVREGQRLLGNRRRNLQGGSYARRPSVNHKS